jgi:hypothetical protein
MLRCNARCGSAVRVQAALLAADELEVAENNDERPARELLTKIVVATSMSLYTNSSPFWPHKLLRCILRDRQEPGLHDAMLS